MKHLRSNWAILLTLLIVLFSSAASAEKMLIKNNANLNKYTLCADTEEDSSANVSEEPSADKDYSGEAAAPGDYQGDTGADDSGGAYVEPEE